MSDVINKAVRYLMAHQDEFIDGMRTSRKVAAVAGGITALYVVSRSLKT
jgi:hypothetical protein